MARKIILASLSVFFASQMAAAGDPMFSSPIFATPLHPGPGTVPVMQGTMVAPVLMPLNAPTAAPVAVYQYGQGVVTPVQNAVPPASAATEHIADATGPQAHRRLRVAADFIYAAVQGNRVPPLVTSAPQVGAAIVPGAVGVPGTTVVFGDERMGNDFRAGLKLSATYWWGCEHDRGVEVGYFHLGRLTETFNGVGTNNIAAPAFYRPRIFFGVSNAVPVGTTPPAGISASFTNNFAGAEANWVNSKSQSDCGHSEWLLGYRFLYLDDAIKVSAITVLNAIGNPRFQQVYSEDRFTAGNQFHGAQLGYRKTWVSGSGFSFALAGKLAMGVTHAKTNIDSTAITPLGVFAGGSFYTDYSGRFTHNMFTVVPEVEAKLGFKVTDSLQVTAGYNFLYWSRLVRAADQIQIESVVQNFGVYPGNKTDAWVQGWTLGVNWGF